MGFVDEESERKVKAEAQSSSPDFSTVEILTDKKVAIDKRLDSYLSGFVNVPPKLVKTTYEKMIRNYIRLPVW